MALPRTAPPAKSTAENGGRWVQAQIGQASYRTHLTARTHTLRADEPLASGGTDTGPTPYEFLLAALGACMAMTLRMYADRKGWPLESVEVRLRTAPAHAQDCENCEAAEVGITRIERQIDLGGTLSDDQRQRLLQIADRCPVKQTLTRGIRIETVA
mgnify:CR=1 FL=1